MLHPDASASAEATSLVALPPELCAAILHYVECTRTIARAARTCKMLHAAIDEAFWSTRHSARYPGLPACDSSSSMRDTYRDRWRAARHELSNLAMSGCMPAPSTFGAANLSRTSPPTECCTQMRYTAAPAALHAMAATEAATEAEFKRGCDQLSSLVCDGQIAADDLLEWLQSDSGSPLRILAALAVLQRRALRSACEPHGLDLCHASLARALRCLRSASPPPSTFGKRVRLKYTAWSSARDCRGFRARDDVHRLNPTLHELCHAVAPEEEGEALSSPPAACNSDPSHLSDADRFWRVLARGVVHEVRSISLSVDEA